jgi:hypothetical protein
MHVKLAMQINFHTMHGTYSIHIFPDAGLEYVYVIRNWAQNSVSFNIGQFENVTAVLLFFNLMRISGI